ncbi:MAG TPA: acyl-CoA reductase [Ferruginibacter sp.]|nr:acyl-CoA reductase [Ferruginibacter sp.]HMP21149.1 acyl-CoA reductase [Ferruginibacter sp.]
MKLQNRLKLLQQLADYLNKNDTNWGETILKAQQFNAWFIPEFVQLAVHNIHNNFLQPQILQQWIQHYHIDDNTGGKNVGIVMAGNIPLVGFHDFLCVFLAGHQCSIKLSSKDEVLMQHIISLLHQWAPELQQQIVVAPMLKGCDAYIATGSNNSARYFDYYFGQYPSIIRRNRTSVAVLSGNESPEELDRLSDDIHLYFGLGCRNVTKLYVPRGYDFVPLLNSFNRYQYFLEHHKYKNNYDYCLSIQIMNNRFYMTNGSTLLLENAPVFTPVSQVHYEYFTDAETLQETLKADQNIQCIVGAGVPFGAAQSPGIMDYADGVDTMQFLLGL